MTERTLNDPRGWVVEGYAALAWFPGKLVLGALSPYHVRPYLRPPYSEQAQTTRGGHMEAFWLTAPAEVSAGAARHVSEDTPK